MRLVFSISFLFLICIVHGSLPTVYDKIYTDITGIIPCFRLTNATSQIGCSATPSNVSGTVWYASTDETINDLLNNGPKYSPYIVILEPELFTSDNILRMHKSKHIKGIVIRYLSNASIPLDIMNFSPAMSCPNKGFGSDECRDWNINGSSLSFADLDEFAIFALTSNDSGNSYDALMNCFRENNIKSDGGYGDYPLCSAQLRADMMNVGSTPECYQRARVWTNLGVSPCDPLGDQNVWGTLFELQQEQNVIMLTTKLDSSSFFPDLSYGANSEVSSIVTLLAVAKALGDMKRNGDLVNTTHAIMFSLFQGESWDYIGSSRMVYDMMNDVFPYSSDSGKEQPPRFSLSNISKLIELGQVGIQSDTGSSPVYFIHSNNPSLSDALKESAINLTYRDSLASPLPPASAQMFLREMSSIPVAIVTDYNVSYNNKFFGSRYDILENLIGSDTDLDSSNPVVIQLTSLATSIARSVLNMSVPVPPVTVPPQVDSELIVELLECFLQNTSCSLFNRSFSSDVLSTVRTSSAPLSRYVTVSYQTNPETSIAYQLLSAFTGIEVPSTNCGDNCTTPSNIQTYSLLKQSSCTCIKSFTHKHTALSPAFIDGNYSSDYYSTWAESQWNSIGMRIYLVTNVGLEIGLLFAGLLISAVSLLVTCQCYRKGRDIFAVSANAILVNTQEQ